MGWVSRKCKIVANKVLDLKIMLKVHLVVTKFCFDFKFHICPILLTLYHISIDLDGELLSLLLYFHFFLFSLPHIFYIYIRIL